LQVVSEQCLGTYFASGMAFVNGHGHVRIPSAFLVLCAIGFTLCERSPGFSRHPAARNTQRVVNTG